MSNLFNSKRGVRGLSMLLVGIIILSILGMFLFNYYLRLNRRNISTADAKRLIISWAVMANHARNPQLRQVINHENRSWLVTGINTDPLPQATIVQSNDTWTLQQTLDSQGNTLLLSIQLPLRGYLNIRGHKPDYVWQNSALLFCVAVLLLLLTGLCYWVVQYISTPLDPLIRAVERFGNDIKAPNILEQGSPEMRTVIRAFNAMQDNIRSSLEGRTQMLAAISHDLRTPITRLKLRAENLDDEKVRQKISSDLSDMEQMITSILAYARQQNADEAEQSFDLNALLESICNDFEDMGKAVQYISSVERLTYFGRLVSLKRAFSNMIENAIKYGVSCTVTLAINLDKVVVTIIDQGPGIPEDKWKKVFEPFYRVDTARSLTTPGSGLGLAVAKEIITAQGGEIQLKNLHPGLQVKVMLPKTSR